MKERMHEFSMNGWVFHYIALYMIYWVVYWFGTYFVISEFATTDYVISFHIT